MDISRIIVPTMVDFVMGCSIMLNNPQNGGLGKQELLHKILQLQTYIWNGSVNETSNAGINVIRKESTDRS